jgi:hypothetical protein
MMKSALVILAVAAFLSASVVSDHKTGSGKGKGSSVKNIVDDRFDDGEAVEFKSTPRPIEPMPPKRKGSGMGKGKGSGNGPDMESLTASSSAVGGATVGVGLGLVVLVLGVGVAGVRNKMKKSEGYSSVDVVVTADVVDYGTAAAV